MNKVTYEMVTYKLTYQSTLPNIPQELTDFAKKFTTFNKWWRTQRKLYFGMNQDIFLFKSFFIYDLKLAHPELEACGNIVMVYPGQEVYFDPANITNGCLDLNK